MTARSGLAGGGRSPPRTFRLHHEVWRRSDLNQEAYGPTAETLREQVGEVQGLAGGSLEAAVRRSGAPRPMSKWATHMSNEAGPPVPDPAKTVAGRRTFSETEKRRIVDEASQPGVSLSQVAQRYGIYPRFISLENNAVNPIRISPVK
jgi:hypothetical protein